MLALEKDIVDLQEVRAGYSKALRELETAMLKGMYHFWTIIPCF